MFLAMQGPFMNRQTFRQRVKELFAPVLVALAALGSKLGLLLPLLKMGGSMIIAFGAYAYLFGWWFAAGFIGLIFIHEMGHVAAARAVGLKVSLPFFLPFFGAVILMRELPRNAWIEAIVGIGGPIFGSIGAAGAAACYFLVPGHHQVFLAMGYFGCFINLFNLIPMIPLDGGRIASAISPWLWVIGLCILIAFLVSRALSGNILAIAVAVFIGFIVYRNLYRIVALFRGEGAKARYFECTRVQRWTMGILYFGLAGSLYLGMGFIKTLMPPGSF
jgi:Zn-dependent protease